MKLYIVITAGIYMFCAGKVNAQMDTVNRDQLHHALINKVDSSRPDKTMHAKDTVPVPKHYRYIMKDSIHRN